MFRSTALVRFTGFGMYLVAGLMEYIGFRVEHFEFGLGLFIQDS